MPRTTETFAKKVHAGLPPNLSTAIPWSLILAIALELLKRCKLGPAQIRRQATLALGDVKMHTRGHVVRKVRSVYSRNMNGQISLAHARVVADEILRHATETSVQEFGAALEESKAEGNG